MYTGSDLVEEPVAELVAEPENHQKKRKPW